MPRIMKSRRPIKRRTFRKRRTVRKTSRKAVLLRSPSFTHSFVRKTALSTISGNIAYAPYQSYTSIQLNYLQNYAEFTALFDQYRIQYVKVQFWMRIDPSAQTASTASYPKLYWCRDLDDQVVLTQNEMRERANCKIAVLNPNKPVTIWIKPNLLTQVYNGVGSVTYQPLWNAWVDVSNAGTTYYGIKYNIDDLTNTNYKVDVETTYYFQCKNTR